MARLSVQPQCRRYSADGKRADLAALQELLQSQRDTATQPIRSPSDVQIGPDGTLPGGLRLTDTALSLLCRRLAPGLSQLISNLSGAKPRQGGVLPERYGVSFARRLLNRLVEFRYDLLSDQQLIVDWGHRQVEGLVGPNYRFLANGEFLTRCQAFLDSLPEPPVFHDAATAGRRLFVRFRDQRPLFTLPVGDRREPFFVCWHFANGELGDCAVRATLGLLRGWSQTVMLLPFRDAVRLQHRQGPLFEERIHSLFGRLPFLRDQLVELEAVWAAARTQPLGLGLGARKHAAACLQWTKRLQTLNIERTLAKRALADTIQNGGYRHASLSLPHQSLALTASLPADDVDRIASRTIFDLAVSVGRVAQDVLPEREEAMEQGVYTLLRRKSWKTKPRSPKNRKP